MKKLFSLFLLAGLLMTACEEAPESDSSAETTEAVSKTLLVGSDYKTGEGKYIISDYSEDADGLITITGGELYVGTDYKGYPPEATLNVTDYYVDEDGELDVNEVESDKEQIIVWVVGGEVVTDTSTGSSSGEVAYDDIEFEDINPEEDIRVEGGDSDSSSTPTTPSDSSCFDYLEWAGVDSYDDSERSSLTCEVQRYAGEAKAITQTSTSNNETWTNPDLNALHVSTVTAESSNYKRIVSYEFTVLLVKVSNSSGATVKHNAIMENISGSGSFSSEYNKSSEETHWWDEDGDGNYHHASAGWSRAEVYSPVSASESAYNIYRNLGSVQGDGSISFNAGFDSADFGGGSYFTSPSSYIVSRSSWDDRHAGDAQFNNQSTETETLNHSFGITTVNVYYALDGSRGDKSITGDCDQGSFSNVEACEGNSISYWSMTPL